MDAVGGVAYERRRQHAVLQISVTDVQCYRHIVFHTDSVTQLYSVYEKTVVVFRPRVKGWCSAGDGYSGWCLAGRGDCRGDTAASSSL